MGILAQKKDAELNNKEIKNDIMSLLRVSHVQDRIVMSEGGHP